MPSVIDFIDRQPEPHVLFDDALQQVDDLEQVADDDAPDDYYTPGELEPTPTHGELEEAPF